MSPSSSSWTPWAALVCSVIRTCQALLGSVEASSVWGVCSVLSGHVLRLLPEHHSAMCRCVCEEETGLVRSCVWLLIFTLPFGKWVPSPLWRMWWELLIYTIQYQPVKTEGKICIVLLVMYFLKVFRNKKFNLVVFQLCVYSFQSVVCLRSSFPAIPGVTDPGWNPDSHPYQQ